MISVVASFPGTSCQSSDYLFYRSSMILLLIIFVIAVPIAMWLFLAYNHRNGNLMGRSSVALYGPLFEGYIPTRWYWAPVVLVRRIIVLAVVQGAHTDQNRLYSYVTIVMIVILCTHLLASPYKDVRLSLIGKKEKKHSTKSLPFLSSSQPHQTESKQGFDWIGDMKFLHTMERQPVL